MDVIRAAAVIAAMLTVQAAIAQAVDGASVPPASAQPQAASTGPTVVQGGTIKGTVKAGETPLPGVAVTATNSLTGKKYATTTDVDGAYQMQVPRNGRYVVRTELMGFAAATHDVLVNASSENGGLPAQTAEFKMELASRVSPQPDAAEPTGTAVAGNRTPRSAGAGVSGTVSRVGRGTQSLAVQNNADADALDATTGQGNAGAELPSLGDVASTDTSAATDSIAVSGTQGQINGLAGFSEDELRNRIQDMQRQGFNNGDIAGAFLGAMQSGNFGGPGGGPGGPEGPGGGFGGPGGGRGGFGGGGRGGFGGGGGGFRGFRGQNPNAWHGTVAYSGYDSALNAAPYLLTGVPLSKPESRQNTLVASFTGSPFIPHLTTPNPRQFVFLSISENRSVRPSVLTAIVPTLAQRYGDLTPAFQAGRGLNGTVYDPSTGLPYGNSGCTGALYALDPSPGACIPQSEFNPSALALLNYYPLPNVNSTLTSYNYQANIPGTSHSTQASGRYNRSFGATPTRGGRGFGGGFGRGGQNRNVPPGLRQSIAENFAYSHVASSNGSFSPLLSGKTATDGYNVSSSYTVGYGRLNSTATLTWNRSRSQSTNEFTNGGTNPAVDAGVLVGTPTIYTNPFYFGVPTIGVAGGLVSLSTTAPLQSVNQTISFSDFVAWSHKRHNMRFGLDFRRIHADSIGSGGALGSFTFSGFATQSSAGTGGSSFADFLLGLPQQTKISAGLNKIYLRGNAWDWYAQDDWRARANLTFNYGLRWEYFSPYSEKNGRLVNLNLVGSGSSLAVSTVCAAAAPAGAAGTACQSITPGTLVKPDKSMFSPRLAVAWQPKFKWAKNTVVRSSYGINYNVGQYSRFASNMANQQPFYLTQTNTQSTAGNNTGCTLANMTLNHGFNCSQQATQSTFGVNPNYRLGMVQAYNVGIQRTLPQGVVLNVDYMGAHAGNLDIIRAPNRNATSVLNPNVTQFNYEDSLGYQRSNALSVNLRNRMRKGIALGAKYTYSHSIDDASSVGGSGNFIAQNDLDLAAEESNSSFDRRHQLTGTFVIEPPFGPNRAFFNKGGVWAKLLDGYSISGNYTFASGGWTTPVYSLTPQEIAAGAPSSLRPDRDFTQPIQGAGSHLQWFNTSAFKKPPAGQYGTASRNSIELPGTVSVNGSLSRTVPLGETRSIEFRLNATNMFNTVQYSGVDTVLNSQTYGQVNGVAGMRSLNYLARFRF